MKSFPLYITKKISITLPVKYECSILLESIVTLFVFQCFFFIYTEALSRQGHFEFFK